MIKADIPQDVTEYKEQFFLGMTGRQIVCVALMIILAVGTFLIGSSFVTTDVLIYLIVFEVAPLAAIGFLKYNGMGFEKLIVQVIYFYIGNQRRKISYLPEETEIHDKVREIALSAAEAEVKAEKKRRDSKCRKK
ncbi:MAG: PrgI family protein [Oscillospiraceae bacterium]